MYRMSESAAMQMREMGENARVRVLHASPDAPAVDIYIDNAPTITNLAFGQISSFNILPAGRHNVKVIPAGAPAPARPVIDANIMLMAKDYTVAAVGMLRDIQAIALKDSTTLPGMNMAKVRVLHASPDTPAVDVAVVGGPVLFRNVSFKDATSWMDVNSGTVSLEVRPSGTTQAALTLPNVAIEAGNLYTFVALGLLRGMPSLKILPVVDTIVERIPA